MRIINRSTVRKWITEYPRARVGRLTWLDLVSRGEWRSIVELRQVFPHADAVTVDSGRVVIVFNVAGNHYRLIAAVHFNTQRVYVREFLTHAEYNRDGWKARH